MTNKSLLIPALALCLLAPPESHAAQRNLSLDEALATARRNRSDLQQAAIDLERADLNLLRAKLERVHLKIDASFTEEWQKLGLPITGDSGTIDQFCRQFPDACTNERRNLLTAANLTIPIWTGFT